MGEPQSSVVQALLVLVLMLYALMIMCLGPRRSHRILSSVVTELILGTGRFIKRALQILIMTVVNTMTLLARLVVSGGRAESVTEAWAKYVERMADVIFKS